MALAAAAGDAAIYGSKMAGLSGFDVGDFGGKRRYAAGGAAQQQRSSPLDYIGNRQVQGEITQNLPFDVNLHKARAKNTQNSANIRTLGQVTNPEQVYIRENQLLFRPVARRAVFGPLLGPPKGKPLASLQVFSMFNGLEVAVEQFPTQFDFENSFEFAGVAKSNIPFGRPEIDGTTVAAIVAGGVTIHNDGDTTFMPGDVIAARLPDIDMNRRRLATVTNAYHSPIGSEGCPTIEREHPSRMYELAQNEMEKYVDKPSAQKAFLTQQVGPDVYPIAIPPQERFFKQEYVRGTATDAWLYIVSAVQAGIVSFNLPDGTDPTALSALSKPGVGLDQLSLNKLKEQTATLTAKTGQLNLAKSSVTERENLWSHARILAALLGLEEYAGVTQVPALRDLFLRRRCAGFLSNPKFSERYQREANIAQVASEARQSNPTLAEKHLWALQRDRATESWEAFWKIYRALSRFRIGRAIGYGPKGGDVDLLM